jgi:hypothetical protein
MFEDNIEALALALAKIPKLQPQTKNLAIQCQNFCSWTTKGDNIKEPRINIEYKVTTMNNTCS